VAGVKNQKFAWKEKIINQMSAISGIIDRVSCILFAFCVNPEFAVLAAR